jgi:peptide deformylase
MAVKDIRVVGDPILRQESEKIDKIDDGIRILIKDLLDGVKVPGRSGLAAVQIGVPLRAFAYNVNKKIGYIINPEIVELSKEQVIVDEGCLSIPNLYFKLKRSKYAKAKGIDLDGKSITIEGKDIMARCIQHEYDHLDGRLFVDRIKGKEKKVALALVRKNFFK